MPMGVLSDDDFESELASYLPAQKVEIIDVVKGRGNTNEVPESLRKVIAEEAINGARSDELEKVFDVSPSSISAYKNGSTSTSSYNQPNKELKNHTNSIKDIISGKARKVLAKALDNITDDKLKDAGIVTLATVARSMSGVVKDLEPPVIEEKKENDGPSYVIYAPQFRDERTFEVIQVKE